jgi:hypothetical protein
VKDDLAPVQNQHLSADRFVILDEFTDARRQSAKGRRRGRGRLGGICERHRQYRSEYRQKHRMRFHQGTLFETIGNFE